MRSLRASRLSQYRALRKATRRAAPYLKFGEESHEHALTLVRASESSLVEEAKAALNQRGNPQSFGLLAEIARRSVGLAPYPVQLAAGAALLDGSMVQMNTGEGKTLAATIPAAFLAVSEGNCQILTFNDYLARRDAVWMGPFYESLGLSVGVVQTDSTPTARRLAYACDVTYATAKQAGFDFLRDGLVYSPADRVQGAPRAAIIDEADSILIDDARTPLVIAGDRDHSGVSPQRVAEVIRRLESGRHFRVEADGLTVNLTENGIQRVESLLGGVDLHDQDSFVLLAEVNQSLYAHVMLNRDVDYLVREGRLELIDELTGRVVPDRRWPDGLQAAVEAKEDLEIQAGGRILGSITFPHLLARYSVLAGMTATVHPAEEEFEVGYGTPVVHIPPHRSSEREDLPDKIFATQAAKERAVADEVVALTRRGRPVLIGTASVSESDRLGELFSSRGINCQVLNARNDEEEARIVSEAGTPGRVTVSTNMAGRGTDIKLGGADESRRHQVVEAGGLHVVGTNRHESLRIDMQLRGRAGRQGDPGSSQFFISLEDPLMVRCAVNELIPSTLRGRIQRGPLAHPLVRREVDRVQRIAAGRNREIRGTTARYSSVLEKQRTLVQAWREDVVGADTTNDVPAAYVLEAIDHAWADQLALAADIREGIHLVRLGGLDPLAEFHKQVTSAFEGFQERVLEDARVRMDLTRAEPPGTGATWTYIVNDRLGGELQSLLFGSGSVAFSAGAALMAGPLLFLWGLRERQRDRGD